MEGRREGKRGTEDRSVLIKCVTIKAMQGEGGEREREGGGEVEKMV
jgi:hypothetical protein